MQQVNLQMSAKVVVGQNRAPIIVQSELSEPVIVITNESKEENKKFFLTLLIGQWSEALGRVILFDAFRNDAKSVSWQRLPFCLILSLFLKLSF